MQDWLALAALAATQQHLALRLLVAMAARVDTDTVAVATQVTVLVELALVDLAVTAAEAVLVHHRVQQ